MNRRWGPVSYAGVRQARPAIYLLRSNKISTKRFVLIFIRTGWASSCTLRPQRQFPLAMNIHPIWLIEADVFGADTEPLKAEIRRQGMDFLIIRHPQVANRALLRLGSRLIQDDDCVIFYGSSPLMREIQLRCPWVPGDCTSVT
jgi:hypothetical protein